MCEFEVEHPKTHQYRNVNPLRYHNQNTHVSDSHSLTTGFLDISEHHETRTPKSLLIISTNHLQMRLHLK